MDEVFRALETSQLSFDLNSGACSKEGIPSMGGTGVPTPLPKVAPPVSKKKQLATVKPISAADEQTMESAIAMAKEAAARSMQEMDGRSESDATQDSPRTPSSPNKRKFSFKFKSSPKPGRRTFSEEAEAIPDIQDSLTEEAKEAYSSLVEKVPAAVERVVFDVVRPATATEVADQSAALESNPLRRLRSGGVALQPKVRGNRHGIPSSCRASTPQTATVARLAANAACSSNPPARNGLGAPPPPPASQSAADSANPLPLPPRDRTRPTAQSLKHHQRKHPLLLLPGTIVSATDAEHTENVATDQYATAEAATVCSRQVSVNERVTAVEARMSRDKVEPRIPPPKPARTCSSLDDSFENQIQEEIDNLDHLPGVGAHSPPTIYKNSDHVSCEDLLEFAMDRPNAKRTQGPARGVDSDEVRIMQKVLAKEKVAPEECLVALNEVDWDVHKGIKWLRLQQQLQGAQAPSAPEQSTRALVQCNWNVQQAATFLRSAHVAIDDTTEV